MTDVSAKELEFFTNESVEGKPLAERLAEGGLSAEEALRYAIDIGTALNRAHRRGVMHGKLSTHSILLTASGARIARPVEGADLDSLPYRSPEQVAGETPDWRSDIFSYGAILYEMVSGRRAFSGEGASLDRAIQERPPATLMGKSPIHAAMEGVIAACMEKDPGRRRQRAQNAVIELKLAGRSLTRLSEFRSTGKVAGAPGDATYLTGDPADIRPKRPRIFSPVHFPDEIQAIPYNPRRQWAMMGLLGFLALAVVALGVWSVLQYVHPSSTRSVVKFPVAPPENSTYRMPAVSPDGKYLAVQMSGAEGKPMLWLRSLDTEKPTAIPGTEGAFAPFWSPDSDYLAFFADKSLKKIRFTAGAVDPFGPVEKICDAETQAGGGTWSRSGTIVFAPGQGSPLYKVPAAGGKAEPLTKLDTAKRERAHLWPQFLPDGKHFVFFVLAEQADATGVFSGALDSSDSHLIFASETNAVYSAGLDSPKNGYLLYIRERNLTGIAFNADRLQVHGDARNLADDVGSVASLSLAPISISETGVLVYQRIGEPTRQLGWVDRSGKPQSTVSDIGGWGPPRISPDGTRAIAAKLPQDFEKLPKDKRIADLWMIDQAGAATQFTSGPGHKGSPVWSPDGSRISYFSNVEGSYDIVESPSNNGAKVETLVKMPQGSYPTDWSHDGRFLIFGVLSATSSSDIWAMTVADRRNGPVLDTIYSEGYAALSPDGKWLAFQSDETHMNQIYVEPFEGISRGTRRRYDDISTDTGGGLPRWRADGKELFFMTNSGKMMSVAVHPETAEFSHEPAQELFQTRPTPKTWNFYDVSGDGEHFVVNSPMEWSGASPITVMTNWAEKLKE